MVIKDYKKARKFLMNKLKEKGFKLSELKVESSDLMHFIFYIEVITEEERKRGYKGHSNLFAIVRENGAILVLDDKDIDAKKII